MDEYDIEIVHRGFEIHPEVPLEGIPMKEYMPDASNMSARLRAMASPYNLEFNEITTMPNTNRALQLGEYAKEVGKSFEFNSKMYTATFVDDLNISSIEELKKIAASVGIKGTEVDSVFATDQYRNILTENKIFCQQNKIQSVPTFIVNDKHALVGAQGPDRFRELFENIKNGTSLF